MEFNIVVCVKPIKTDLVFPNEKRNESFVLNPYDLKALSSALALKAKRTCHITCICMGAAASEDVLLRTLAMGADQAILLNDRAFSGSDTVATTYILAKAIKQLKDVDLILCGEKSVDGETGQVAFGLAERLNMMCVAQIDELLDVVDGKITYRQKSEKMIQIIRTSFPSVAICSDFSMDMGKIRLPDLKRAKKIGVITWKAKDMDIDVDKSGIKGSKTKVLDIQNELVKKKGIVIQGEMKDKAIAILKLLTNKKMESIG